MRARFAKVWIQSPFFRRLNAAKVAVHHWNPNFDQLADLPVFMTPSCIHDSAYPYISRNMHTPGGPATVLSRDRRSKPCRSRQGQWDDLQLPKKSRAGSVWRVPRVCPARGKVPKVLTWIWRNRETPQRLKASTWVLSSYGQGGRVDMPLWDCCNMVSCLTTHFVNIGRLCFSRDKVALWIHPAVNFNEDCTAFRGLLQRIRLI